MALDRLTKVDGGGISTTSDYRVGIITASKFVGSFDGTGGNFSGIITASGANFSGNVSIGGTLTYEDVTNIDSVGLITARNGIEVSTGTATTALVVNGDARVTGILTVGTSSLKLDGPNNLVNVGTALTLGHSQGVQFHTQNLHSAGFEVNQINASGIITATGADINGNIDVDGHTNLDNVSVAGITTFSGILDATNTPASIRVAQDIQHKGDADTKITFPANDTISFDTAGSERLRIGSNGDIYIRKAESGARKGSAALEFYGTTSGSVDRDQAKIESSAYAANSNAGNLDFYTQTVVGNNLSLRMRIDGEGKVGIGTANPTQNLHILGSSTSTVLIRASTLNGTAKLQLQDSLGRDNFIAAEGADNLVFAADEGNAGADSYMRFKVDGDEKVRITSGGTVNIGGDYTNTTGKLKVTGVVTVDGGFNLTAGSLTAPGGFSINSGNVIISGDIAHDADSDTTFGFGAGADTFRVQTNGNERLRIGSNGSVGIGTDYLSGNNSVYHKLMVEGDTTSQIAVAKIVRRNSSASNSTYTLEVDSSSHTSNVANGGAMSVDVNSGRAFTINGFGRVGIGTDNPQAKLEIAGSTTNIIGYSDGQVQIVGNNPIAFVSQSNLNPALNRWGFKLASQNDGDFSIYDYRHSSDRLLIDSSGRVLIGTTTEGNSSGDDLTIQTSGTTGITLRSGTSNNGNILFSDGTSGDDEVRGVVQYAHSDNSMRLMTNASERLRITSDGKLGIGTNNPTFFTHIQADGITGDVLRITATASGQMMNIQNKAGSSYPAIVRFVSHDGSGFWDLQYNNNDNSFSFDKNDSEKVRILSNGNFGIGTNNPSQKLEVLGTTSLFGNGAASCQWGDTSYIGHLSYSSDGAIVRAASGKALIFHTNHVNERVRITSGGEVKIGTSNPTTFRYVGTGHPTNNNNYTVHGFSNIGLVGQYSSLNMPFDHSTATTSGAWWMLGRSSGNTNEWGLYTRSGGLSNLLSVWKVVGSSNGNIDYQTFSTGASSERIRITSSGQLLLGETSAFDSNVAMQFRKDNAGSQSRFIFRNRGNNGSSRVRLVMSTLNRAANADIFSGMEQYQSGGMAIFNGQSDTSHCGIDIFAGNWRPLRLKNGNVSNNDVVHINAKWGTSNGLLMEVGSAQSGTHKAIRFLTSHYGGERGYIGVTLGGTSYNSSSDYRMKQDVVDMTGAIDRIKLFLPKRFKWKEDPTYTVDGFLAHEASTVVPESVVGEKDAVDSNGDPEYQVMDNSKLVPVLTAALKEAIAKIEILETKVAALEGS